MLGWTIIFALMSLPGAAAALSGYPEWSPVKTSGLVFALLCLLTLLTQAIRGRAR
jgi:hypothetical protein